MLQRMSFATMAFCWLICSISNLLSAAENPAPNIVLIITDDQGYGPLGRHGHPWLKTPHLDRLHDLSTRFTRFLVSPTCSPTRSALMTGRHSMRNGITHTILERERLTLNAVTLPQILKKVGYTTGIFGKWHLGDEEPYQPYNRGFDETFIHGAGGIGQAYACSCADSPKNSYFDPVIRYNGQFVKTRGFCTDVFFSAAAGWISKTSKAGQPFFAYIAPNAPHGPYLAPEASKKRFLECGFDEEQAAYYGMIENIDDNVGKLINHLDEGGVRVPFFVRWDKHWPAQDIDRIAGDIDIFPTLAAIAGAELPENQVEGRNLLPLANDPSTAWEDRYLFTHVGRWETGQEPNEFQWKNFSVRNQRFRFVNDKQLFDMQADPGQTTNVLDQHPEVASSMRKAYDEWWKVTRPMMVNEGAEMSATKPYHELYNKQLKDKGIPEWEAP